MPSARQPYAQMAYTYTSNRHCMMRFFIVGGCYNERSGHHQCIKASFLGTSMYPSALLPAPALWPASALLPAPEFSISKCFVLKYRSSIYPSTLLPVPEHTVPTLFCCRSLGTLNTAHTHTVGYRKSRLITCSAQLSVGCVFCSAIQLPWVLRWTY